MEKTLRKQVRAAFKSMPFTDAINATIEERKALLQIMPESKLNRMTMEASKSAGMYNLRR